MVDMHSFPAFFYCNRCYGRQRRLRNKRPKGPCSSYSSAIFATATALLLGTLRPIAAQAQLPSSTPLYTPRHSAGSSIANNTLFIVSGTNSTALPYTATADTLAVSLNAPFTNTNIPWIKLQEGYLVQDARVATTVDQKYLVLAGTGNQVGQVAVVFDIVSNIWAYLPSTAAANVLPQTARTSVPIAMDPSTGLMVLYGGVLATNTGGANATYSLSAEFDFLDTRSTLSKWSWSAALPSPQPPPGLVQPILLYLPTLGRTLIMGGCNGINVDESIQNCMPFSSGYMVNSMLMAKSNEVTLSISSVSMVGPFPEPRLSPCAVVLASGDVFMYGGATANESLGDAWVLKTGSWTWVSMSILNMPIPGRTGATCQLATADQIILVGGFNGALTGPREFSDPQVAIINTTSWLWSSDFTPAIIPSPTKSGLSTDAIIGIISGGCVLLAIVIFFLAWYTSRSRYEKPFAQARAKPFHIIQQSQSKDPLVEDNDDFTNDSEFSSTPMTPFNTHLHHRLNGSDRPDYSPEFSNKQSPYRNYHQQSNRPVASTTKSGLEPGLSPLKMGGREREPFLIIPYSPYRNAFVESSVGMQSTEPRTRDTMLVDGMSDKGKRGTDINTNTFKKGDQLPQTMADIQHGHYIKTLQHQKQYERRRLEESLRPRDSALHRSGTRTVHYGGNRSDDEVDGLDLATGLLALRDVDFGEEPVRGKLSGVDDGAVLLSSHLDTTKLDNSYL